MSAFVVFAVAALATYGVRASMVVSHASERVSPRFAARLAVVTPVVLSALVARALLVTDGHAAAPAVAPLLAVVAATIAARRSGSLSSAFLAGLPTFWIAAALGLA